VLQYTTCGISGPAEEPEFVSNLLGQYMVEEQTQKTPKMQPETVKFLSLGGEEDVTRNMYLYEYKDQILIVDCGLGFPDETMLGVDLLLPDIAYLLHACMPEGKAKKKIVGMLLTHGHEDHIGGLPYILPQLPSFPIYGWRYHTYFPCTSCSCLGHSSGGHFCSSRLIWCNTVRKCVRRMSV
jgi:predicted metal-dependent RNase